MFHLLCFPHPGTSASLEAQGGGDPSQCRQRHSGSCLARAMANVLFGVPHIELPSVTTKISKTQIIRFNMCFVEARQFGQGAPFPQHSSTPCIVGGMLELSASGSYRFRVVPKSSLSAHPIAIEIGIPIVQDHYFITRSCFYTSGNLTFGQRHKGLPLPWLRVFSVRKE